jgi:hypothetical protein
MAVIGLRNMIETLDLFPINKVYLKFDINGDMKHPIYTAKHAVRNNSCDFFENITMEMDVPLDIYYSPTLTVYIYDNVFGVFNERLIGCANISLYGHCYDVIEMSQNITEIMSHNPAISNY